MEHAIANPTLPSLSLDDCGLPAPADEAILEVPQSSPLIQSIREEHRKRQDFHRSEKSLTLRCKAICRRLALGDKKAGQKLYKQAMEGDTSSAAMNAAMLLGPFLEAKTPLKKARTQCEKKLELYAKTLPIAEWVEGFKGLGLGSIAALVGECGDLSNYPTHSKVWKRMGLAPYNGKALSLWRKKGGVSKTEWQVLGYSPARRSISWNIAQSVFKAQSARVDKETGEEKSPAGHYRKIFDDRKVFELTKSDEKLVANCRALRYMEKRLIRDIWREWNRVHSPMVT